MAGRPKTLTAKATTTGPARITYTAGGSQVREEISGPWEKTVELTGSPTEVTLIVEANTEGSVIGCEIVAGDARVHNVSSGGSATVSCRMTV